MTDPELLLVARLGATSAVTAIVGTRIRPLFGADGDAVPLIVFERSNTDYETCSDGSIQMAHVQIEVYCIAVEYADAKGLAAAVRTALAGWADSNGNPWHIHSESDDAAPVVSGQEIVSAYVVNQTYGVQCAG